MGDSTEPFGDQRSFRRRLRMVVRLQHDEIDRDVLQKTGVLLPAAFQFRGRAVGVAPDLLPTKLPVAPAGVDCRFRKPLQVTDGIAATVGVFDTAHGEDSSAGGRRDRQTIASDCSAPVVGDGIGGGAWLQGAVGSPGEGVEPARSRTLASQIVKFPRAKVLAADLGERACDFDKQPTVAFGRGSRYPQLQYAGSHRSEDRDKTGTGVIIRVVRRAESWDAGFGNVTDDVRPTIVSHLFVADRFVVRISFGGPASRGVLCPDGTADALRRLNRQSQQPGREVGWRSGC